jgi:hypothetical protein
MLKNISDEEKYHKIMSEMLADACPGESCQYLKEGVSEVQVDDPKFDSWHAKQHIDIYRKAAANSPAPGSSNLNIAKTVVDTSDAVSYERNFPPLLSDLSNQADREMKGYYFIRGPMIKKRLLLKKKKGE